MSEFKKGIMYATFAYIIWGILPIYWNLVNEIVPFEILAHRIIWSAVFMLLLLTFTKQLSMFKNATIKLFKQKKMLLAIIAAGYIITVNWGTFIWAVNNHHVLQASLGYYINPLMSIFLAFIFLGERFSKAQWIAIALAFIGVIYMTFQVGEFPYVSILLATSFALYGLIKKVVDIDAFSSITIECIVTLPAALIYIFYLSQNDAITFGMNHSSGWLLLSGAITAIPLILFSAGARRIPLSLTGFIQYIGPTLMFFIGIFLLGEHFDVDQLITFIFIWAGIILYSYTKYVEINRNRKKLIKDF
ncbi:MULTISPECIES: EamA family transporter RarD [Mammaliicoccus]|uniref:EamA family transporter RarD n=1 Tax=Mammaliicoccus fleurettii TaxID=150056 RepID=A0ABS5MMD6_9STAP|nr:MULTISPECIES: EamA family transporter RarD [Mammaliicoccus]MBL0847297.1 EamA family transporter RarD [Mammaliicoccus fleurettii]MBS3672057.1 EamA family transporter RarD [Mammaliicoccus fleurettii]MBS3697047.1 EamA family transporter RarD [Mammaliicoccus fleurettii]MEB6201651.1 EamA family transporter RarD [Mammaliicoccus fleurettii]MEB7806107.1 EamA family transporter RarD [Mammaliicoccus fleurettii]